MKFWLPPPSALVLMHELREDPEPELPELLLPDVARRLGLGQGFKRNSHPKIEIWRPGATGTEPLFPEDPMIRAVLTDQPLDIAHLRDVPPRVLVPTISQSWCVIF